MNIFGITLIHAVRERVNIISSISNQGKVEFIIAANATFALNVDEWFLLFLFIVLSTCIVIL